ncbi:MAG TPA: tRNA epoxyqueuosine(34) reductase QueG [Nitrospiria bacterium]
MTDSRRSLTRKIIEQALALGFDSAAVCPAEGLATDEMALERWLSEGRHGGMAYMARDPHRRSRPEKVLPGARSLLVLALNYTPGAKPPSRFNESEGRVSRYAWGRDYHGVIEPMLEKMESVICGAGGAGTRCRSYVDYGPVLEKAFARQSGLGFIGKNTLLITGDFGSWVFLSVILTTLELEAGTPMTSQCGACTACLDACPTGALTAPYQLDARRCISYLTIEKKDDFSSEDRERLNGWVFGCDICQEVCPFNERAEPARRPEFRPALGTGPALNLNETIGIKTDDAFRNRFQDTPLLRPKRKGLQRNARALLKR